MIEGGMRCEAGQETHRAGRMSCVPHLRGGRLFEASRREAPQDEALFLMPSITCSHAEERPGPAGAHLEARTAPAAAHSCPASALFRPTPLLSHRPARLCLAQRGAGFGEAAQQGCGSPALAVLLVPSRFRI
jgi:hypothetical protein